MFTLYFHDTAGVRWLCDADDESRAHMLGMLWSRDQQQDVTIIRGDVEAGGARFVAIYNAGRIITGTQPAGDGALKIPPPVPPNAPQAANIS